MTIELTCPLCGETVDVDLVIGMKVCDGCGMILGVETKKGG